MKKMTLRDSSVEKELLKQIGLYFILLAGVWLANLIFYVPIGFQDNSAGAAALEVENFFAFCSAITGAGIALGGYAYLAWKTDCYPNQFFPNGISLLLGLAAIAGATGYFSFHPGMMPRPYHATFAWASGALFTHSLIFLGKAAKKMWQHNYRFS